jgi:serine/threonine-protein kinase RsbW
MAEKSAPDIITLTLPSRLELLGLLDRVATTLCERIELDEATTSQVSMSVIEAGTNAIQHGHRLDPSKLVDVRFELWPDKIEITVRDTGPGFDVSRVNGDITSPEHLFDARGRGIYIMRACMDEVSFDATPHGTTLHLVKRRPAGASAAAG